MDDQNNQNQELPSPKKKGRKPLDESEIKISEERRVQLVQEMERYQFRWKDLAQKCELDYFMLMLHKNGRARITEKKWQLLQGALDFMIAEATVQKYVLEMLERNGCTVIQKHRILGQEKEYIKHLEILGYKCRIVDVSRLDRCYKIVLERKLINGR
ncbi:MAG TPA: hypothetical protein DCP62_00035 [Erysipelotrichaceae bacterium]|nr:hypothetical protein [Erysipelotrichaceae bacterium]